MSSGPSGCTSPVSEKGSMIQPSLPSLTRIMVLSPTVNSSRILPGALNLHEERALTVWTERDVAGEALRLHRLDFLQAPTRINALGDDFVDVLPSCQAR